MASVTWDEIEAAVLKRRHRITVDEYHKMSESGALGHEPRRYELIRGVIVERISETSDRVGRETVDGMGEGSVHAALCDLVEHLLHRLVPAGYFASIGHPLTIARDSSELIPDAMVLRGSVRDYMERRRTPADAALVVEVSHSSLNYDQSVKAAMYAAAGVPVYWIINVKERVLEVRRAPFTPEDGGPARYGVIEPPKSARSKADLILDGRSVGRFLVRELLP